MLGDESRFSSGVLCVSLDFELYYGVSDLVSAESFQARVDGARRTVPALLELFAERQIHATWATVGMLLADSRDDLVSLAPQRFRPAYLDPSLSNYRLLGDVGDCEAASPHLLAASLTEQIRRTAGQELATHTFSHFYALEPGATIESFEADLWASVRIAERLGAPVDSIVFPRNQYALEHLDICRRVGLKAFRGNPPQWMHRPANAGQESALRRAARLLDAHAPLSATNLYSPGQVRHPSGLANVPASRFLRAADAGGAVPRLLERRIRGEMRQAAETGKLYHLWWHPHNFGGNLETNLDMLRRILDGFSALRQTASMRSLAMNEVAQEVGVDEANRLTYTRQRADAAVS